MKRLSQIAAPDARLAAAANLAVAGRGEDIGVARLAHVVPAVGGRRADAVHAGHVRALAEPAADEDVVELVGLTGGEHLAHGAVVELVHHLAVALAGRLECVLLELGAVSELLQAELAAPFVDDVHVAAGLGGLWVGFLGGFGCGLVDLGAGRRGRRRRGRGAGLGLGLGLGSLNDDRGGGGGRRRRGRDVGSGLRLVLLSGVDGDDGSFHDGVPDDVHVAAVGGRSGHGRTRNGEEREILVGNHCDSLVCNAVSCARLVGMTFSTDTWVVDEVL